MSLAGAHEISDSDSDATIDPTDEAPDELSDMFTGDLNKNNSAERKPQSRSPKFSQRPYELTQTQSKLHEISDSDTDDEGQVSSKSPGAVQSGSQSMHQMSDSDDTDTEISRVAAATSVTNESRKRTLAGRDSGSEKFKDARPWCTYGRKCFRKNPSHLKEYRHPEPGEGTSSSPKSQDAKKPRLDSAHSNVGSKKLKNGTARLRHSQPLCFLLTTVAGIDQMYNASLSLDIKDILSPHMGKLQKSAQFNYMFDIKWLVEQYPAEFRKLPLLLIHGCVRQEKASLEKEAKPFSHITLCQARLEILYGTHHTKMMMLLYEEGMRVVIHTANLIHNDWHQRTQGIWVSPLFPKLSAAGSNSGDSSTHFKHDLLEYLGAYNNRQLHEWQQHIRDHDMSQARVYILGSTPGRHTGATKNKWGHLKLRKILQEHGPAPAEVKGWPVIGQFSSIGSLGDEPQKWLGAEWWTSLSTAKGSLSAASVASPKQLQLIYPCKENVRTCLEGYPAGGSLPYSLNVAKKQKYLHTFFNQWKSEVRGRSRASPHIKTYCRMSPDGSEMAWFAVTSANLSKAAWGALEKQGCQLMIRSYELGVLFLPKHFGSNTFRVMKDLDTYDTADDLIFPVPYDLPPVPYTATDRPWVWDIPYVDKPDTNGMKWCPPLR